MYTPPFEHTSITISLLGEILRLVGRFEGLSRPSPQPMLRRQNRIKTIAATTAIEGNTLSLDQVAAVLDGKQVLGPRKDILEVQNAIATYDAASDFASGSKSSLLKAHRSLMKGLLKGAGAFRKEGVGIFKGPTLVHTAPPAERVPWLVKDLLHWYRKATDEHLIIRSAVMHYELAFIHPFMDGNGRTARFWQHVILRAYAPVFEFVPMESLIQRGQSEYYDALASSDKAGSCTAFLEFSLQTIHDALDQFLQEVRPPPLDATSRLKLVREHLDGRLFSRKEYMAHFKTLSSAQASRDLRRGVDDGVLTREGKAARTRYRF